MTQSKSDSSYTKTTSRKRLERFGEYDQQFTLSRRELASTCRKKQGTLTQEHSPKKGPYKRQNVNYKSKYINEEDYEF